MSGATVSAALDRVLRPESSPRSITVDYGTEFMSRALKDWAYRRGVQLDFIRPGVENAFIEAYTAPRAGGLGADHLRRQLRAGLSSGAVQSCGGSEQSTFYCRSIGEAYGRHL